MDVENEVESDNATENDVGGVFWYYSCEGDEHGFDAHKIPEDVLEKRIGTENLRWLIIILHGSNEDSPNYDKRQVTANLRSSEEFKQYRQINTKNTIEKDAVGKFKFISAPALEQIVPLPG